jgi:leader peptidase (prepilin peptidase) / N-methyltransferase
MPEEFAIAAFIFLTGLVIGSFLNVCIHRMPRDESIVWPGSHCPGCGHAIAAYDNIPVASYLLLGARCRHCRRSISWRYPVAELATGLLFLYAWHTWGASPEFVKAALFIALCVGMMFTDLETRILPDQFTIGGMFAGFALAYLIPRHDGLANLIAGKLDPRLASLAESILGAALIAGLLWALGEAFYRFRKMEYLGLGDVKMVGMMMAFLGILPGVQAVFIGSALGALTGGAYLYFRRNKSKDYALPFGTFLGAGSLIAAFVWR